MSEADKAPAAKKPTKKKRFSSAKAKERIETLTRQVESLREKLRVSEFGRDEAMRDRAERGFLTAENERLRKDAKATASQVSDLNKDILTVSASLAEEQQQARFELRANLMAVRRIKVLQDLIRDAARGAHDAWLKEEGLAVAMVKLGQALDTTDQLEQQG